MFMLYAVLAGLAIGLLLGGRPAALGAIRFRWGLLAIFGLASQVALFSPPVTAAVGQLGPPLYVASTLLVLLVVVRNIRVAPALTLVAVGAAANLAAIVANGGYMPVTPAALSAVVRGGTSGYSNSVELVRPALEPLVDLYALPAGLPFANVFSLGDVLIAVGITVVIALGMTRRGDNAGSQAGLQNGPPADSRGSDAVSPGPVVRARRLNTRIRARAREIGSPRVRVIAFSTALALAGVAGLILLTPNLRPTGAPLSIPWPLFAFAYYVAEIKVIDVHFRRETHSFSLSEVPAVVGLFFVDPKTYILGMVVGAAAALVTVRQPTPKIFFNLSYFLLGSVVSLGLFQAIAPLQGHPGPSDWLAAFVATLTTSVIGAVLIATVITLSGSAPQFQRLPQMLQVGALFAVTNTSLALLAVAILWDDPLAIWLVAVPVGTLFVAYRAYLSERQKHESLELLYESSRIFQRSPELDSAILSLLEHLRMMFRSDRAEVVVHGGSDSIPLRTAAGPGERAEVMVPAPDRTEILARLTADPTPFIYVPGADLPASGDRLFRFAMVSPLRGESGLLGAMLVADRTGDSDEFGRDELRLLETVANQAAVALENGQLEQSLAELSRLKEELRHQAFHDPLTGLANRALFLQRVEARLGGFQNGPLPVVLFLDLDDFKVVNDTVGHGTGDALLRSVAERILGCIRDEDVAARLGGDEFAVVLGVGGDLAQAGRIADRIAEALRAPFRLSGREFTIGASIGVAAGAVGQRAEDLLRNADVAMYAAKARGKGQLSVWDPQMHRAVIERHELSTDLSRAISRDELGVDYQPLVALDSGLVVGFEALARWNHPTKGRVPAAAFIALAEESGVIVSLGRRIFRRACEQAVEWGRLPGLERLSMSVNLSPHQVARPEFIDEVGAILDQTGLDPRQLILEMTETAMFRDMDGAVNKLQTLREAGVRLAVDDFGMGYSSLHYLRQFPVDVLKIAREFIAAESDDRDQWAFAHAIVVLGRTLGLTIVAEGIEKPGQLDRLRQLGCDRGQGYLFSRPLPPGQIPAVVAKINGGSGRAGHRAAARAPSVVDGTLFGGAGSATA